MVKHFFCFSLCTFLCLGIVHAQNISSLTNEQKSWLIKADRHERNGWIYLHIEGAPQERGFQHGYLMAKEIGEALRILKVIWEYQSATSWSWLVAKTASMFTPKVDPENLMEIDGIQEGMSAAGVFITRNELVTWNGWKELFWYWWPMKKDSITPNASLQLKESCSSFIASGTMTSDGQIVIGHNTWDDYYIPAYNIILDIVPSQGHRILMQSAPGHIHSSPDFFVTDAGIVGSETTIGSFFPFDSTGVPEFVRVRRAMQDASSIDEWCIEMKKGNNGGYANSWLLGDIKTNEIARFELGLKYFGFEKKKDGYFCGSNIAHDLNILRHETKSNEVDIRQTGVARKIRWNQLMKEFEGKIDVKRGQLLLSDHYDIYLKRTRPDSRTICGHMELDEQISESIEPFRPLGAYDGKVMDARMAKELSFVARWGAPCGTPFHAAQFLKANSQFDWMQGILKDWSVVQPWTKFKAGERKNY